MAICSACQSAVRCGKKASFFGMLIVSTTVMILRVWWPNWQSLPLPESWQVGSPPVDQQALETTTAPTMSGGRSDRFDHSSSSSSSSSSSPNQGETDRIQNQTMIEKSLLDNPSLSDKERGLGMKILIYMTTHLSDQHKQFLSCWEDAIPRFRILHNADLMLYTAVAPTSEILKHFNGFQNVTVKMYKNTWKQAGAIQAMIDPWEQGWFEGYDWVIRLNPDVLIRNETWLLNTMLNALRDDDDESGPVAIAVSCFEHRLKIHTDFTAFRPNKMVIDHFINRTYNSQTKNAEEHMTRALAQFGQKGKRRIALVPGTQKIQGCRVMGPNAPIIHHHSLANFCPDYYNKTDNRSY